MDGAFIEAAAGTPSLATSPFGWLYYGLAVGMRADVIVECGVGHGYATAFLARAAKDLGVPFFAIDDFSLGVEPGDVAANLDRCGVADAVTLIGEDSVTALSRLAPAELAGKVALVILDTMHTFEMTTGELSAVWKHLGDGSIVGSHDAQHAGFPGVRQALLSWSAQTGAHATWFTHSGGFAYVQKMCRVPPLLTPEQFWHGKRIA